MNQITLYRKGGRKPWVFEWCDNYKEYKYRSNKNFIYYLRIHKNQIIINRERFDGISWWFDLNVTNKIHADHFKLGNVTITF